MAECRSLLPEGVPTTTPIALDGTGRSIPLGVDIDGDVAATAMLRPWARSGHAHQAAIVVWLFHFRHGQWVSLGGGACVEAGPWLVDRRPAAEAGGYVRQQSGGGVVRNANRLFPWGRTFVCHAELQLAAEVDLVRIGSRQTTVPPHGHLVVVWATRQAPTVDAYAVDGRHLGSLNLYASADGPLR